MSEQAIQQRTAMRQHTAAPATGSRTAAGPQAAALANLAAGLNARPAVRQLQETATDLARRRPNQTGMPDALKGGIEALSGMDMSDVRVTRDSAKPAQLNALALAQGNAIHLGPGQERHLPHEAWHVVQQRQGRVRATTQLMEAAINDDPALEHEATIMGARAAAIGTGSSKPSQLAKTAGSRRIIQRQRNVDDSEKRPFPKLDGKPSAELAGLYRKSYAAGMAGLDKIINLVRPPEEVSPAGKFEANWTLTKSVWRKRTTYEFKHKKESLKTDGQSLHYKNVLIANDDGTTIEALSNYGPTREMRLRGEPGCDTFLTDVWKYMLEDHAKAGGNGKLRRVVRSNIENTDTLATIFLCNDFKVGKFQVSSAADRVALLGTPNGIGYLQMIANYPQAVDLSTAIENGQFMIEIEVFGPAAPALRANMTIG